jgi:hypothetical protein
MSGAIFPRRRSERDLFMDVFRSHYRRTQHKKSVKRSEKEIILEALPSLFAAASNRHSTFLPTRFFYCSISVTSLDAVDPFRGTCKHRASSLFAKNFHLHFSSSSAYTFRG